MKASKTILTADISGTNMTLAAVTMAQKPRIVYHIRLNTQEVNDLYQVIDRFITTAKAKKGISLRHGCIAVAGPVKDNSKAMMTHADLVVDASTIIQYTALTNCMIINDFEALGYALNVIDKKQLVTIRNTKAAKRGTKAVIGAGTDLGKCIAYYDTSKGAYLPLSSEGAHADFPAATQEEMDLCSYIKRKNKSTTLRYGSVVSGRGLEDIYSYLAMKRYTNAKRKLTAQEISAKAREDRCSAAALKIFFRFYARAVKNFALESLSTGGIYIAGGIMQKNIGLLDKEAFLEELGRFVRYADIAEVMDTMPVYIIQDYDISHLGAAFAYSLHRRS